MSVAPIRQRPLAPAAVRRRGAAALSDEQLLAVLLGSRWSPEQARSLLLASDGLAGLPGTVEEQVPGAAGARLAAGVELGRRAAAAWRAGRLRIRTPADLADRLLPEMGHLSREELVVISLDTKNAVIRRATLYAGNLAGCPVRVAEVFADAIRLHAAAVVVAHNHPSGDPSPSGEDLRISADLAAAGRLLDVELLDHLVIGHGRWVSLRALGALGPPPDRFAAVSSR